MNTLLPVRRLGAGSFAPPPAAAGKQISPVQRYIRIAYRWRFLILSVIVGCALLGLLFTFLMTPRYSASTTLEIARESNKIVNIQGVQQEASLADQEFYQTQYGLLRSRSLAERVARDLKLIDDRTFFEMFKIKPTKIFPEGGQSLAVGRDTRERIAVDLLLKNIAVFPTRLSRLVVVQFTSPNAAFSAKVVNTWALDFIQLTLERRYDATSYARKFLESRLSQLRVRLEESERQLVAYASAQHIINVPVIGGVDGRSNERSLVADDLASLNTELNVAIADRIKAQARVDVLRTGGAGSATEALGNLTINSLREKRAELSADYQRLMTQFEPAYPTAKAIASQIKQIDQSIAREESRVSASIQGGYRGALTREQNLSGRVEQLKSGLLDQRRRSIQYTIYQREVDTNRQLYDGLLQRYKEVGVTGGVGVNNVAIVDPAIVPERPSSPRLLVNLIIAILAGVVLGAAAALILEQVDEEVADPAEVERVLGIPLLGSVPKLADVDPITALEDRKSDLVEAYLAIQTNLEFSTDHGMPRSFAITSTRPSEGKSTSSLALATMLARNKRRVILVDGDMRSPSIHHLIGSGHERGLSNFLSGNDDIDQLIVQEQRFGLAVMTAGPIPPNAAELLTGDRLALLITRLLERFDHIVVDSPPVMGLADAPLIGSRVEGVVYAVEAHGIRTSLVRTAIARLVSANTHLLGTIVTKFEVKRAHYGYGYDYGYGYGRQKDKRPSQA